jgi:hypothetical protein
MLTAKLCWKIFDQSIDTYHKRDHVDQPFENPFSDKLEALLYHKNWIDTVQWHLEDICRDPKVTDKDMAALKRRIDKSNQDRTDKVEQLDDWIIDSFKSVKVAPTAQLNTESPAWVIDRLSILALKIFHMREQVERKDADQDHIQKCQNKLNVLLDQKVDLSQSFDDFMQDIAQGKKRVKVYRQMKMYNDEKLNPALYNNKK